MKIKMQRIAVAIVTVIIVQSVLPYPCSYASARTLDAVRALSLPDGQVGQSYEYQLKAEGGMAPLAWRLVGGELPPGISFNAASKKAIEASKHAKLPRAFWNWTDIIEMNASGYWPYTPNTNLLYALSEALDMILGEGLENVFARHQRLAEACRTAVHAWGLEVQCADPAVYSPVLTGVMTPAGFDADAVRKTIYENFDMSLGTGLGKMKSRMFRIGHLGEANDLTLMATLSGCEMGLKLAGVPLAGSGVLAAMEHLSTKKSLSLLKAA